MKKIKEAIILAGGLGTRLRSEVPILPKCMADVNGNPFIYYVLQHLERQNVERFIFALGYKNEFFINFLADYFPNGNYYISIEDAPLGTGGAIKKALNFVSEDKVLVLNGDSLFEMDIELMLATHLNKDAACTLALKPMTDFDRYGIVKIDESNKITFFQEKQYCAQGLVSMGCYLLDKDMFITNTHDLPDVFSIEKDFFEKNYTCLNFYAAIQDEFFIDIGIPHDYQLAKKLIK